MNIQEIPLIADNQQFTITLAGVTYTVRVLWRDVYWVMDLMTGPDSPFIAGIPLVTGVDLLAQYGYLSPGFKLFVVCDDPQQEYPTKSDPGTGSHLLVVTE
ncbi:hypothetical protein NPU24_001831 [Escherichia coli]|nr:hypothetical protein [Escherichia coli]EKP3526604.1 hypothetical protein [Escherichia coli]